MSTQEILPMRTDQRSVSVDVALATLGSFDHVIDVRSPSEFAQDHIPGALNAPVLDDEQRAHIGTLHKQDSAFAAKRRGAALVARSIAEHIEQQFSDMPRTWKPLVYCWRGGQRSGAMAHVFAKVGWRALQLDGGYRAYRRSVISALETLPLPLQWQVLTGTTGSGKSQLLQHIHRQGGQVLDLEGLAHHRGSVLGGLPSAAQPSQKRFESALWSSLRGLDPQRPVFVESESAKVGALRVPETLLAAIRQAPCLRLEAPMACRVEWLRQEYEHLEQDAHALIEQLRCLIPLHGKQRFDQWVSMIEAHDWPMLVQTLLTDHYDPAYQRSIKNNFKRSTHAQVIQITQVGDASFSQLAKQLIENVH